jgi:AcrR family transcriptional regulator
MRFGVNQTSVEGTAESAGISKASFYRFFRSKDELYASVLMSEIPALSQRLIESSFGQTNDTREALLLLMQAMGHEITTNPLSRVLLWDQDQLKRLSRMTASEQLVDQASEVRTSLAQCIAVRQERGDIVEGDPNHLLCSIDLITAFVMNRGGLAAPIHDLACQVVVDGLTCPTKRNMKNP